MSANQESGVSDGTPWQCSNEFEYGDWIGGLSFSPNGQSLSVSAPYKSKVLVNRLQPSPRQELIAETGSLAVYWTNDKIITANVTRGLEVWDVNTGLLEEVMFSAPPDRTWAMRSLAIARPASRLIVGGTFYTEGDECYIDNSTGLTYDQNGWVEIWDLEKRCRIYTRGNVGDSVSRVAISSNGTHWAAGGGSKIDPTEEVLLLANAEGDEMIVCEGEVNEIAGLALHPSGNYFAAVNHGDSVRFWKVNSKSADSLRLEASSAFGSLRLEDVSFHPTKEWLIAVGDYCAGPTDRLPFTRNPRGVIQLWNTCSKELVKEFPVPSLLQPQVVTIDDGGLQIAVGGGCRKVCIWNIN